MAQRHQRGWLRKEKRSLGETWVLFFRTTRQSDGKRVENKIPIALVRHLPDASSARAEVERLHLPINRVDVRRGLTFGDLVQHYAEHELVDCSESIPPKAHTTELILAATAQFLWLWTGCWRKESVSKISFGNIVLEPGIAIGAHVFVEKVKQDLNFRREP